MTQGFLSKVYDKGDTDARKIYAQWSQSYDAEISQNGYATPMRAAQALANAMNDKSGAVLDFGCGTGLSGHALRSQGFDVIDGIDVTPEMIDIARAKAIYRDLCSYPIDAPPPVDLGSYSAISAVGVISPGAAPIAVLEMIVGHMSKGAKFVFSFNDHALADPSYESTLRRLVDTGALALVFCEHGDHLPGIGLMATVYVVEKL